MIVCRLSARSGPGVSVRHGQARSCTRDRSRHGAPTIGWPGRTLAEPVARAI